MSSENVFNQYHMKYVIGSERVKVINHSYAYMKGNYHE